MTVNDALCNSWHSSVVARIILSIIYLVVRGLNQVKGIFFASEKDFSGISEAAVSLMVSHIIWPGICVLPSQTTMRACARVVVIETDCLNWQLQRPVGRPNGHRPLPLIDYTCFTRVFFKTRGK